MRTSSGESKKRRGPAWETEMKKRIQDMVESENLGNHEKSSVAIITQECDKMVEPGQMEIQPRLCTEKKT